MEDHDILAIQLHPLVLRLALAILHHVLLIETVHINRVLLLRQVTQHVLSSFNSVLVRRPSNCLRELHVVNCFQVLGKVSEQFHQLCVRQVEAFEVSQGRLKLCFVDVLRVELINRLELTDEGRECFCTTWHNPTSNFLNQSFWSTVVYLVFVQPLESITSNYFDVPVIVVVNLTRVKRTHEVGHIWHFRAFI